MDAFSAQLKKEERETRARILKTFRAAQREYIEDVMQGRRKAEMETHRIWRWFWLAFVPVPVFFRTETVISLQGGMTTYYMTPEGKFVGDPYMLFGFWHKAVGDEFFKDYVSTLTNGELVHLTDFLRDGPTKSAPKKRKRFLCR